MLNKSDEDSYQEELEATGGDNPTEFNRESSSRAHLEKVAPPDRAFKVHQSFLTKYGKQEIIRAKKSDWIHNLIRLDGEKFSFKGRKYLRQIYDSPHPHKLLKTGRQVEKSTMLANEFIVNSCVIPYFKTLYVAPSHDQTRQFSNGKLKPWIDDSPVIQKYFQNSSTSKMVFERSFTNGSIGFLRSAFLTADRTRGVSADCLNLDEIQDILVSNIPVMLETLSHSKHALKLFSGTPKTLDNPIELYWQESSQCEWLVPCDRHAPVHYNYLDERCIGREGLICNKCGKPINAEAGRWIAFSPNRDIMGYRIAQLMTPWFNHSPVKWKEIIWKLEHYARGLFNNEVLGLSFDAASKPVTRTELIACCSEKHPVRNKPDLYTESMTLFGGIDWGEGSDGSERGMKGRLKNASYTILSIGTFISPKIFHVFYMKRYIGEEALPANCIKDIIRTLKMFKVACIGVDWGHGWGVNDQLEQVFNVGGQHRVIKFQYVGMQKERKKFDQIGIKYQLNRTEVMTDFFEGLKKQEWCFPTWEVMKNFLCDVEHIHAEFASSGMLKYDHRPSEPDDAAHSLILCREAADNYYGR